MNGTIEGIRSDRGAIMTNGTGESARIDGEAPGTDVIEVDDLAAFAQQADPSVTVPSPGTVAALLPEPSIVTVARVIATSVIDADQAVRELQQLVGDDRLMLDDGVMYWTRQLGRRPSDDFDGHLALRLLLTVQRALR